MQKNNFYAKISFSFFGNLKKAEWVSGIELSKKREAETETNFSCKTEFCYPADEDELSNQLEEFKLKSKSEESTD